MPSYLNEYLIMPTHKHLLKLRCDGHSGEHGKCCQHHKDLSSLVKRSYIFYDNDLWIKNMYLG